jgi:hypothetical protein
MKFILSLIFIISSTQLFSQQDCIYSSDVKDTVGTYKVTKDYLMHERFFGNKKSSIYFSLINADGLPSLSVQLIQKDTEFIMAKCFDKHSKLYFQLANGKVITLLGMEQETCGSFLRKETENIRILTGYFLFVKENYEELKKSPISLLRIKFSGESEDFVLKSELLSELDNETYLPENYFINYLKCVE